MASFYPSPGASPSARAQAIIRVPMMRSLARALAVLLGVMLSAALYAAPVANPNDVQTAWLLLDYMAVDYGGAVEGGRVKSASEYAEMTEFAASVSSRLATLPPTPERAALFAGTARL